ncbi:hypothetical protein LU276_07280 [Moraxella haemolytica]|uniref:ComF family protein n=1 Tax=Moraxella haemolytica TaxID=2904119 RepID=UPI002543743D|nr:hypothetical protein [Moraxella sp. ZY171148]WII94819.1 hypothetical protein LU276_07280 [Moraxella sp. ZY171148]
MNNAKKRTQVVRFSPYFLAQKIRKWHGLCALCHEPITSYQDNRLDLPILCSACHHLMRWHLPPILLQADLPAPMAGGHRQIQPSFYLYCATFYQYPINYAINRFKDHESLPSFMVLLHAIHQLPKPIGCHQHNTVIVPIPTTNKRLVRRGFDPVTMLTKALSHHWGLPIWQGLCRVDDKIHQRGLDRQSRLSNIQDAFAMTDTPPVSQIILFDDVVTTGATLKAAATTIWACSLDIKVLAVCIAHGSAQFSHI